MSCVRYDQRPVLARSVEASPIQFAVEHEPHPDTSSKRNGSEVRTVPVFLIAVGLAQGRKVYIVVNSHVDPKGLLEPCTNLQAIESREIQRLKNGIRRRAVHARDSNTRRLNLAADRPL